MFWKFNYFIYRVHFQKNTILLEIVLENILDVHLELCQQNKFSPNIPRYSLRIYNVMSQ